MILFQRKEYWEKRGKTEFIVKNGKFLLEKLITIFNGKRNPIRNFTSKELKQATNNYDIVNVTMDYGFYKLYKGFLQDHQISVMKFESIIGHAYDECINNIVFASQMCHKHILKLVGCCLETRIPILVFESLVKYGNLRDHIHRHHESDLESLSWRQRLKISMEIGNIFAHLHIGFPRPIVYSYMSSSKFLLDEHYVPKLIDFSNAECIPKGETHIKDTQPRGLFGYVAPEHILRGVVNEKCDVYGFGALLLELLTRQRLHYLVHNINETKGESSSESKVKSTWWNFLNKIIEDDRFIEFVDPIIVGDGLCPETLQQMKVFVKLAVKCISITPKDRPTMIDVAKQLKQLHRYA